MRRAADFLIRNWPLKVAAVLLASVLYSGLVLGQNVRTWTGTLPVEVIGQSADATLLSDLEPVTVVRYRAPLDVGVISPASFLARVDLSRVEPEAGGPLVEVPVTVNAINPSVQIVDFQPQVLSVRLDPVASREIPVTVELLSVPDGLNVGPPQTSPSAVTVRGASSRVEQVTSVQARVPIDASALNIDREVELVAIDANGNQVQNIEIDPERARVRVAVARELANRTLPVVPQITGQPAPGHRITSITVEPLVVTVSGEETTVTQLEIASTEPIDVNGRTRDVEALVRFALPPGVGISGSDTVRVVVTIAEETATRTYQVGVDLEGETSGYSYGLNVASVSVTLGGPIAALDAVDASQLIAVADVSPFVTSGERQVGLTVEQPAGLAVVAISPDTITVVVTAPPSPTPSPLATSTPQ